MSIYVTGGAEHEDEIARLRSRLADEKGAADAYAMQLAEAEALLQEVSRQGQDIGGDIELFDSIDAFLNRGTAPSSGK